VKDYGKIAAPLTMLLKKNAFQWSPQADVAFLKLKDAMCTTPVLAMLDFSKTFVIESDACGVGIGVVLMQEGHPLAFTSRALFGKNLCKSTYEKEMLAIIHVVQRWRPFIIGCHFIILTDHHSLKFFIEQWISTPEQQKWVTKLLGYDYEIIYNKGKENVVADALSKKFEDQVALQAISYPIPQWLDKVKQEWVEDSSIQELLKQITQDPMSKPHHTWHDGILKFKGRILLPSPSTCK